MRKAFVEVIAKFDTNGAMQPTAIVWEDGKVFAIERVIDVRQAASLKVGGQGTRYLCRIRNKETYLFFEMGKWFVEAKE